jgi:hypothetical protein
VSNLVLVAGRKGCGKSTLLRVLVRYHLETHPDVRFVVWDRTAEWVSQDRVEVLPANECEGEEAAEYALSRSPCTLVMDEVDLVAPNHLGGLKAGTAMHAIVHYGRHEQVAMLCAARRSANVHIDVRALADVIFFFRHIEPNDLGWIGDVCGVSWAEAVRRLPPKQFLRYEV